MTRPGLGWALVLAAALGTVATSPAGADDPVPTAHLRAAFDALPVVMPDSLDPFPVVFVDREAAARVASDAPFVLAERIPPLAALAPARPDAWSDAAGVLVAETSWFVAFGSAPESVTVWGGLSAETMAAFRDRLPALGFDPLPDVPDGFANGPAMGLSLIDRAPGDPWRGTMGTNYAVALADDGILQAQDSELLLSALGGLGVAGSRPIDAYDAVLAGLDAAAGDGVVVQVAAFGPSVMPSADPTQALAGIAPADLPAAIERLKAEGDMPGIPPFFGGMLADIRGLGRSALAIALLYPDCAAAETVGAAAADLWAAPRARGAEPPGGRAFATTMAGAEGMGCAAIVTVDGEVGSSWPPFDRAVSEITMRDFPPLRQATP